jgi:hypothetical protein
MPSNPNKPYELRNISRIDKKSVKWNSENHGWQVRFLRNRKPISQWFEDSKYGKKENSLKEAKLYRDGMEKQLGGPVKGVKPAVRNVTPENLVGVRRRMRTVNYRSGPQKYPVWTCEWPSTSGRKERRAFAENKYGEDGARNLAIEARNKGVEEYYRKLKEKAIHKAFKAPSNPDIKIWRYMDFTKFVSILQQKGLFFPVVSELEDQFEGSFSKANKLLRPLFRKHDPSSAGHRSETIKSLRDWTVVSCWHMNEQESAAMWNLYARTNEAICIQSTLRIISEMP